MTNLAVTRPALRYHGAKFRLAPWIVQFFPPHAIYVEPFGGAAGVLLRKPRVCAEVYNDLDGDIVNFFRVVRDRALRADLVEALRLTPYAREEFDLAFEPTDDALERARRTCVRAGMGFGSASATSKHTGFRIDTRRKYGTQHGLWLEYPESLAAVGERFSSVLIEHRDALEVMRCHDSTDTLFFVDPPYLHSTRKLGGRSYGHCYRHEMTDGDHRALLEVLLGLDGMVVLSAYPSELYAEVLGPAGWLREETRARISAGRGTALRVEVAWLNPACSAALERGQAVLFSEAS